MNEKQLQVLGVNPIRIARKPETYLIRIKDNAQSLSILQRLAEEYSLHPRIRKITSSLIKGCPERDLLCYVRAITRFVKRNVKYVNDPPGKEVFQSPLKTLEYGMGDCDDFAVLTASLLLSAGIPAKVKIKPVAENKGHVVVEVLIGNRKFEIDTTKKNKTLELGFPFFHFRRWRIARLPLYRCPNSPVGVYRELWEYKNGRPVKLIKRFLLKVLPGKRIVFKEELRKPAKREERKPLIEREKRERKEREGGFFRKAVFALPVIFGIMHFVGGRK